ncbi:hypothetical protein EON66_10280 [archaeon]|nr:MAG: hypothetical protein EON66_10280 [archaeon]
MSDKRAVIYEYPKALGVGTRITLKGVGRPAYITDGCSPSCMAPIKLLISSPQGRATSVYHQFKKDAATLYIPTPTPEEVLLMRDHCCDATRPELSDAAVQEHMARWGPIPRYVLNAIKNEASLLATTIEGQQIDELTYFVQTKSEEAAASSITFRLVHYHVSANLREATYKWASPHVGKEVVRMLQKAGVQDQLLLLAESLNARDGLS